MWTLLFEQGGPKKNIFLREYKDVTNIINAHHYIGGN